MADTQTPNFQLVLIQVGTSRDTWGEKTNDNLTKIDTALKAIKTTADGALPKAGGIVAGEIVRENSGSVPYWDDPAMASGRMYFTPDTAANPTGNVPGRLWFGYTP